MIRNVSLLGSFVWSKSIDDADSVIPGLFDSIGAQDERNLRLERGLSFFDVRKRVSARGQRSGGRRSGRAGRDEAPVIFVDWNVPLSLVGADHPNKAVARRRLEPV